MKKAGFFLLLSIFAGAAACVAPGPATDESVEEPEEKTAEAQSEIIIPCISSCECDLGFFCYVPAGNWVGSCIPDMFGPTAPVCFEDCQCGAEEVCGPWMLCEVPTCFSDCDCDAGDYCSRGACLNDPFTNDECTANCQCSGAQTCQNGQCVSGGGYYQPK